MCQYQEWDRESHRMGNCQAEAVSDGLCAEHLEWVADCRAPAVSKLDMKYPYKAPRRKSVKLGPSRVVETILEPGALKREYKDYENLEGKNSDTFLVWFSRNIRPRVKAPQWTEAPRVEDYAEQVAERQALEDSPKVKAQYARTNAQAIARSEAKAAELERMKANDKKIQPCIQKDTPTPGMVAMQVVIDKHDQADRDAIVNSRRRISAQIARESVESRMAALC